jgi:hypothetical protein
VRFVFELNPFCEGLFSVCRYQLHCLASPDQSSSLWSFGVKRPWPDTFDGQSLLRVQSNHLP